MHRAHTGLSQMEPSTEMGSVHQLPSPTQKLSPINIHSKKKFCNKSLTRYTNHSLWSTQKEFNGILGIFPLIDLLLMFSWLWVLVQICVSQCLCFIFLWHILFCPILVILLLVIIYYYYYYMHLNSIEREKVDLCRWECGKDLGKETNQNILH